MPDNESTSTTTAVVAAICSVVSGIVGAALAKLPDWLKYLRGTNADARKSKKEDNEIVTANYDRILNFLQEQCTGLIQRSDENLEKIEALQASHLRCVEEHAETKGELRAIMLRLGLQDAVRTPPVNIALTLKEKPSEGK